MISHWGIHWCISTNCILYVVLSKSLYMGSETKNVATVVRSASHLITLLFLMRRIKTAPARGRNVVTVKTG